MKEIILSRMLHRNCDCIKIKFAFDSELHSIAKSIPACVWTNTHKAWYIVRESFSLSEFQKIFSGKAIINSNAIEQNQVQNLEQNGQQNIEQLNHVIVPVISVVAKQELIPILLVLNEEQTQKINSFKKWLASRRYASSTINTYTDALTVFLRYYGDRAFEDLDNQSLIDFNNNYVLKNKLSASYQNQIVNAIKLFFSTIENKKLQPELIHRPKRQKLLPNVLSKQEVKQILNVLSNLKHRAMLSLIYSCGLRRGELLNLKLSAIDPHRHLLIIKQSKGRKDRIVPLSEKTLDMLRKYYEAYKPKIWLFEGQDGKSQYDERSLASVLKQAVDKCRIIKPVTLHWLRHSYATHLLESGTDLRYIQEILGHSSSRTTEIYTHVSNKSLQKIISPFDSL